MNPEEKLEYMEVEDIPTEEESRPKTSPSSPKKRFASRFSFQSPGSSFPPKTSSNIFRPTFNRKSRSDLRFDEKEVADVSKSFGQFTFGQVQPINSEYPKTAVNQTSNQNTFGQVQPVNSEDPKKTLNQNFNQNQDPETEGPKTEGPKTEGPETEEPKTEGLKTEGPKKLRKLMKEKKPIYTCSCWQIIFFSLLPLTVVLLSTILSQEQNFCEPSFNFTNLTENLPKFVHGQSEGVSELIDLFKSDLKFKIVALVGGTGVGKSHVANILKNSLPKSYYIFEHFPPLYKKVRQVYSALSTCQCNVIILENLGTEDISDAAFFAEALRKKASDLCVLILGLFNTQITDSNLRRSMDLRKSLEKVEGGFRKEGIEMKAVGFEPLGEESIVKCIMEAIEESSLKVEDVDVAAVKKSLLRANAGCKGAYSKVQLLGKNPN